MAWRSTRRFPHRSAGLAALGDLSNATMARLHALRSVILVERGELERASAEAAKAVSCEEDQDTPGPYFVKLSSSSPEGVCLACASLGDAAHLRKAARLIPRTKSNYATGFVLRAAARFHARRNDPDACAAAACGAARARRKAAQFAARTWAPLPFRYVLL